MTRDSDRFDFFVSYARADNSGEWITRFVEGILAEHKAFSGGRELSCFFDKSEIQTGHDWEHRIHHGVAESRVFLAFISPRYFASEWCRKEWRAWIDAEIAKHVFSDGAAPVYIVKVPGFEDGTSPVEVSERIAKLCELPPPHAAFLADAAPLIGQLRRRQFVAIHSFYSDGLEALRREDLRAVLRGLAKDLDVRAERVRLAAESANTVPPYNRKFSGRVDELLTLRKLLTSEQTGVVCGLHGLGGIGKTELAFAYAHAFAGLYPGGRLLVPCDGKATIREAALALGDFADFRGAISDEERKTPDSLFAAVLRCLDRRLEEKGNVLLVLDNVTNAGLMTGQETDELTKLGPKLHLLMTTRLAPTPGTIWLPLGELPETDAMELLEKHRPFASDAEREAGQRIVKRLGGFAMPVELVAAWLAVHEGSNYRALAERIGLEDLETIAADETVELRRHNHERRLTAVLGPVLASLGDLERRTLEMAAFLPPDVVALPWLKAMVEGDLPGAFEATGLIADPWAEICSRLTRLALFSRAGDDDRLVRIHRLVQDLVNRGMSPERIAECRKAVESLVQTRDAELEKTAQWQNVRWELEPFDAMASLWAENAHASAEWLLNQIGVKWQRVAEWARAEPLLRRALASVEASYGADHPMVADHLNNLAALLQATNRLSEAEALVSRALRIDMLSHGADHPNVARDLTNAAQLLKKTNRLSGAEPLMRLALEIDEASYGTDHPRVALDMNNLAMLLQATNRLTEAEPLMRRALRLDETHYGADHPDVARDLNNLAQLLKKTNRLSEAEPLMRRVLAIDEASYGADHHEVATDLDNLAQLLRATNRLGEAEPLTRRALAIDEASYGADHPRVATHLSNLAELLHDTNRLKEAEPLLRRALRIVETSYGADHTDVARCLGNLAQLLQDTNRLKEAEPLMRRALAICEASYGADHPEVAIQLHNLALLLKASHRLREAEPLMRRALEIVLTFTRSTHHEHPHLTTFVSNYATLLLAAKKPLPQVFSKLKSLGPEPPAILSAMLGEPRRSK